MSLAHRSADGPKAPQKGIFCNNPPETTMLKLTTSQRAVLVEKLPDVANVAAGAMVFGQLLGGQDFSIIAALAGAGIWLFVMGVSLARAGKDDR
jgi:hypothetical protein